MLKRGRLPSADPDPAYYSATLADSAASVNVGTLATRQAETCTTTASRAVRFPVSPVKT